MTMHEPISDPDEQKLVSLYRANVRRIHGFARNRVGEAEAAEIVGEVFHAAALAFRRGDGDLISEAWLMAVARNKINDHWRRAFRRKAKRHLSHADESDLVEFPSDWTADPRREAVVDALDRMPERDRALLVLHHIDGMRVSELAAAMDKSVSATESALARARRRFRANYRPTELDHG